MNGMALSGFFLLQNNMLICLKLTQKNMHLSMAAIVHGQLVKVQQQKIDPKAWSIVDGKLYLNYNKKIQARWEQDANGKYYCCR